MEIKVTKIRINKRETGTLGNIFYGEGEYLQHKGVYSAALPLMKGARGMLTLHSFIAVRLKSKAQSTKPMEHPPTPFKGGLRLYALEILHYVQDDTTKR